MRDGEGKAEKQDFRARKAGVYVYVCVCVCVYIFIPLIIRKNINITKIPT